MVQYKKYIAGWLDSSIHDFLVDLPDGFPRMQFVLIACLDSNPEPARLLNTSPELEPIRGDVRILGSGLLLRTDALLKCEAVNRIMFGFDEVWFFPDDRIAAKPTGTSLVGPRRISQSRMDILGTWMESNSCSMALGDGEGLNFIVKAQGLLKYFVSHSISQPAAASISKQQSISQ